MKERNKSTMAGGEHDSSLTRVQPVFLQLARKEPSGIPWLGQLLGLGSRAKRIGLPTDPGWTGQLLKSRPIEESFELPCSPSVAYLEALVNEAPDRMPDLDKHPELSAKRSEETIRKRKLLRRGDATTKAEALAKLATRKTDKKWWVLEGTTMVDCAIFAKKVTVFIEGKRTESHLTGKISWDTKRHQVFRNLDVLEARQDRAGMFFVLLIVDKDTHPLYQEAIDLDTQPQKGYDSWPHKSRQEAEALWSHYLGFTTWQDIDAQWQNRKLILPKTKKEAIQAGLTVTS